MSLRPDLCIYHANCMDGFTAAWVVARKFPGIELVPASYGDAPPDVLGKTVLIVDFSYPKPVLEAMARHARLVAVLDHHASAEQALWDFEVKDIWFSDHQGTVCSRFPVRTGKPIVHFDMSQSGARLAWQFCHPGHNSPAIVDYVEDRDLWRWVLPESREINAAIGAYTQDLQQWDTLNKVLTIAQDSISGGETWRSLCAASPRNYRRAAVRTGLYRRASVRSGEHRAPLLSQGVRSQFQGERDHSGHGLPVVGPVPRGAERDV